MQHSIVRMGVMRAAVRLTGPKQRDAVEHKVLRVTAESRSPPYFFCALLTSHSPPSTHGCQCVAACIGLSTRGRSSALKPPSYRTPTPCGWTCTGAAHACMHASRCAFHDACLAMHSACRANRFLACWRALVAAYSRVRVGDAVMPMAPSPPPRIPSSPWPWRPHQCSPYGLLCCEVPADSPRFRIWHMARMRCQIKSSSLN